MSAEEILIKVLMTLVWLTIMFAALGFGRWKHFPKFVDFCWLGLFMWLKGVVDGEAHPNWEWFLLAIIAYKVFDMCGGFVVGSWREQEMEMENEQQKQRMQQEVDDMWRRLMAELADMERRRNAAATRVVQYPKWYALDDDTRKKVTKVHQRVVRPGSEGEGKTARNVLDGLLNKHGLTIEETPLKAN